ncbi:hypothetical protein ACSIGC_14395 [Tenacibaculum sp. ZS6-P6]|uniref:hypothetical protein n=1 Tax=Tenacibaculum sp. ZS6-P6 TaxID=3447503 RepID=UPI003F9C48AF
MYNSFLQKQKLKEISKGKIELNDKSYKIPKFSYKKIAFELYVIQIDNLLDTEAVYGYKDETKRYIGFH